MNDLEASETPPDTCPGDDDESVVSTLEEASDSDEEWTVEGILAETEVDGEIRYLVEWTGYPLGSASWEPVSHLTDIILDDWEELKKKRERGEAEPFPISRWTEAVEQMFRAKHRRHQERNKLRLQRSHEVTRWSPDVDERIERTIIHGLGESYIAHAGSEDAEQSKEHEDPKQPRESVESDLDEPDWERLISSQNVQKQVPDQSTVDSGPAKSRNVRNSRPSKSPDTQKGVEPATYKSNVSKSTSETQLPVVTASTISSTIRYPRSLTAAKAGSKPGKPSQEWSSKTMATGKPRPVGLTKSGAKEPKAGDKDNAAAFVNVFAGGTVRKARTTLVQAASDATKDPKLLRSRFTRIIQKGQRDKENDAPSQLPKKLICLDPRSPQLSGGNSPAAADGDAGGDIEMTTDSPPTCVSSMNGQPTGPSIDGSPPSDALKRKKRKSVHWDEKDSFCERSNTAVEGSLFVPHNSPPPTHEDTTTGHIASPRLTVDTNARPSSPPPSTEVSMGTGDELVSDASKGIIKSCLLGSDSGCEIDLLFRNIPHTSSHPSIVSFRDTPSLSFGYTCIAEDVYAQGILGVDQQRIIFKGEVLSPANANALETVGERLRFSSSGILFYDPSFCVLLFPSNCGEWSQVEDAMLWSDSPLRYIVFTPESFPERPGFELTYSSRPRRRLKGRLAGVPHGVGTFLKMDYHRLIPSQCPSLPEHHVFLAFPLNALEEAKFMAHWLQKSAPVECHIYDSFSEGDWFSFIEAGSGTVIICEDVIHSIRQFPDVIKLLRAKPGKYSFFAFRNPLAPSMFPSSWKAKSHPGNMALRRILPSGSLYLLTPSFIVSAPEQALHFLRWFVKRYRFETSDDGSPDPEADTHGKLAVPHNICDFLVELMVGRKHTREHARSELEALKELWKLFDGVLSARDEFEVLSPVVLAPKCINENDDQSLVNWFGWWTVRHMDVFARFHVLGSREGDCGSMTRRMKPVCFKSDTIYDTVQAYEVAKSRLRAPADDEQNQLHLGAADDTTEMPILVKGEDAQTIKAALDELRHGAKASSTFVFLYAYPMAYWHHSMPFHFADTSAVYSSFEAWFKFSLPLHKIARSKGLNTYAGFFYTITGTWNPDHPELGTQQPKRPWLAIFRPVNPHLRWEATEILIWDPAYRNKFKDQPEVSEECLIEAQRQLLRTVNEMNRTKNPEAPLEKVWLGGWNANSFGYNHPIDATLVALEAFIQNTWTWLPASTHQLLKKDWKFVREPRPVGDEHMEVDDVSPKGGQPPSEGVLNKVTSPPRGSISPREGTASEETVLLGDYSFGTYEGILSDDSISLADSMSSGYSISTEEAMSPEDAMSPEAAMAVDEEMSPEDTTLPQSNILLGKDTSAAEEQIEAERAVTREQSAAQDQLAARDNLITKDNSTMEVKSGAEKPSAAGNGLGAEIHQQGEDKSGEGSLPPKGRVPNTAVSSEVATSEKRPGEERPPVKGKSPIGDLPPGEIESCGPLEDEEVVGGAGSTSFGSMGLDVSEWPLTDIADDEPLPALLFHPPHGTTSDPKSFCSNALYRWSKALERKGETEESDFRFLPLNQWYEQQVQEGRDFKHILVHPWDVMFRELGISGDVS